MMPLASRSLASRSLGLGLLTTLAGSFGLMLPGHAAPDTLGTAADLDLSGGSAAVVETPVGASAPERSTLENLTPENSTTEVVPGNTLELTLPRPAVTVPAAKPAIASPTWADPEAAIAAATVQPQGQLPAVLEAEPGGAVPLANRRENAELFDFRFGGDQLPLNPPSTQPLTPVGPGAEAMYTLTLAPESETQIPANGRSTLTLVGAVTTDEGNPLADDVVVTLTSTAGEFVGADYDADRGGFQVLARLGQFEAQLRSPLDARPATVQAFVSAQTLRDIDPSLARDYPTLEATTQVSFYTDLRPTIISGVVDFRVGRGGTNFLGSFRDFLNPDSLSDDVEVSFTTGLFATGAVGDWLFTGAYNNTRGLNDRCDGSSLYRDVQACDQTYPVYGDSSTTDFLTPSIDSLYLRFQRDSLVPDAEPDYFMWGDYGTQEFAGESQQFTATVRELHGFKGNYTFGNGLQLTAMYADNVRPFQRDTIAPDGTSGYYFLSRRLVLRGSENVFIEAEEFNRPGTVLERTPLYRGVDYTIDYDRGTLLFNQPVRAVDLNPLGVTLVRRIVVTYQVEDASARGNLYAGRLQYRPNGDDGGVVGATLLSEDQGAQDFTLYGFDVLWPLGDLGQVTGEFARSTFNAGATNNQGNAYRIELSGTPFEGVTGQAFYRSTDSGFNNTATSTFRPGQTRWGGQVLAQVGPQTQIRALVDQERNLGTATAIQTSAAGLLRPGQTAIQGGQIDNTLTELRAGIVQQFGSATLGIDFVNRNRDDRIANTSANANQLVSRLNLPLTETLSALAQSELNLGTTDPLYPTRNTVGLEWAVQPGVSLRLAQQFLSGGNGPSSITSLDTLVDYELDDNTTLTNRYSLLGGYNGITGQGAIGLNHRLVLAPGLRATFGFERIFGDGFNLTGAGQQFAQPFAVGQGGSSSLGLLASTVYSVGLEYTDNPDWQASGRFEYRDSPGSSNIVLGAAAAGKITDSLTGLARFDLANFANQTITDALGNSSSLRLGLAYRNPVSDQFNGLLSYEYRRNPGSTPDSILQGTSSEAQDHTLSLEGIYAPSYRWEFYGKYGLRYSTANLAEDFGFSNSIHLAQARATYRFAYRWDVGAEVRWLGQPAVGYNETGFALEAGYYLTPDVRLGLGYSFGGANDGSFVGGGGYRSASGPYFGITAKVNQLFNGFGVQPVSPPQQQDSYVDEAALTDIPEPPVGETEVPEPGVTPEAPPDVFQPETTPEALQPEATDTAPGGEE
ncbi:TonB-dependent receptor [Nodosilinea sp. LEGE 06152]|uniref:TonB-dependent receptor n=1 Tax=Nodosilinea sp. LEGE 06152 TaxID=2777966 RepID=UPI001882E2F6|nr:TonB-dependent receptor [Nodosilinea sp. LEGE 06152]